MNDAGPERDLVAPQAVRIAGAVDALVMVPNRRNRIVEEAEAIDDARAFVGMALHQRPLLLGEARGLQEDRVRDRELPDVVEQRCVPEQIELGLREPEFPADRKRELLDTA